MKNLPLANMGQSKKNEEIMEKLRLRKNGNACGSTRKGSEANIANNKNKKTNQRDANK